MLSMRIKSPASDFAAVEFLGEHRALLPFLACPVPNRPDPRIIVILKCSQSFASIFRKCTPSHTLLRILFPSVESFFRHHCPRTRKTRVEEASPDSTSIQPRASLSCSLRHRFHPSSTLFLLVSPVFPRL